VRARARTEIQIQSPTACILTLHGEHDLASRPGLTVALAVARGYVHVLVDLTHCTFGDASLVSTLLVASKRLRARDGALELVVPPSAYPVRRVLELAGAHTRLPIHETRAEGIASMSSAETLRAHPRRGRLRLVSARIDHLHSKTEAARHTHDAKARGFTVVRAEIADAFTGERHRDTGRRAA
jgi:anti-anti-sigma regulatory factor